MSQVPDNAYNSSSGKLFVPFTGYRTPRGLLKGSRMECASEVMNQVSTTAAQRRAVAAKEAEVVAFLASVGLEGQFWPSFQASGLTTMAKVISISLWLCFPV